MTVAVSGSVYEGESSSSSSLSISVTVPSGSDRVQTVGVSSYNAKPTGVVFNTTETHTEQINTSTGSEHATLYTRTAPTVTTANVVVSFAAAEQVVAGVVNFTGVDQTTPVSDTDFNTGASQTTTSITLTSATGDMCVDAITWFSTGTEWTQDGGQTQRWYEFNAGSFQSGGGSTESGASSVTMTWNRGSGNGTIGHVGINLAQSVAAGANPKGPLGMPLHGPFGGPL